MRPAIKRHSRALRHPDVLPRARTHSDYGCRWYLRALASRVARQEGLALDHRDYRDAPWRQKGGWACRL